MERQWPPRRHPQGHRRVDRHRCRRADASGNVCSRGNCPRTGRGLKAAVLLILRKEGLFWRGHAQHARARRASRIRMGRRRHRHRGPVLADPPRVVCVNTYLPNGGGEQAPSVQGRWMAFRASCAVARRRSPPWLWSGTSTSPTPKTTSGTPKATPRRAISSKRAGSANCWPTAGSVVSVT